MFFWGMAVGFFFRDCLSAISWVDNRIHGPHRRHTVRNVVTPPDDVEGAGVGYPCSSGWLVSQRY